MSGVGILFLRFFKNKNLVRHQFCCDLFVLFSFGQTGGPTNLKDSGIKSCPFCIWSKVRSTHTSKIIEGIIREKSSSKWSLKPGM